MSGGRYAPYVVHVAGAPAVTPSGTSPAHALQRCVACGVTLIDNTAWLEDRVAVATFGADAGTEVPDGPTWYEAGALVATDKEPGSHQASITYVVESGTPLGDDERPCVGAG